MRRSITLCALSLLATVYADTLGIEVTKAVECTRKTENGDTITVNYKGTLESDGSKFDSSYDRNQPFSFRIGSHQVIAGWDQGLLGMCIGEGRKLTIPPHLAYGNEQIGKIPAGSTLIFETELLGIEGVEAEPIVPARPTPGRPADLPKPSDSPAETPAGAEPKPSSVEEKPAPSQVAEAKPTSTAAAQASPMEEKKGECNLLGDFALIVQGALGLLAVSSLVYKRFRESPRRPIKIWFFDVSKQVFGSVLLHLANILMSMLSSGKFDVAAKTKETPQHAGTDEGGDEPNPCSFYLLNLAIDTTIGIPILVILLKLLHRGFLLTPMANPPESIRSGNYGHPPRVTWWLKQAVIYFLGLIGMKLCVLAIFELLPWIAWVGDWALRWTEGNTAIQITFVMFIFPLIMNALQYWIIDGFIKDPAGSETHYVGVDSDESDTDDDDDHEWLERQRRRLHGEESDLEEANPTPMPIRKDESDYDPSTDGAGAQQGNSRDGAGKERRD